MEKEKHTEKKERMEYRKPDLSQGYKPLFKDLEVMRAAGPMITSTPPTDFGGFSQSQWGLSEPAPLVFGDMGLKKPTMAFSFEPAPLEFSHILRKPTEQQQHLENVLDHSPKLEPQTKASLSPRELFEASMSYPGVSFTSPVAAARAFDLVARSFARLSECDVEARASQQRVKGYSFSGTERCKFAGKLARKDTRWAVELQRVSGSAVVFNELVARLARDLAGDVSDVQTTGPFVNAVSLFGKDSSPAQNGMGEIAGGVLDDECCARLLAMATSQCVDVRREGLKNLASLATSEENWKWVLNNPKDKDAKEHPMVRLIAEALASEDDEVRWSGTCLLANMSQSATFCIHLSTIFGSLLELLQGETSYRRLGEKRNIELAVNRIRSHSSTPTPQAYT